MDENKLMDEKLDKYYLSRRERIINLNDLST